MYTDSESHTQRLLKAAGVGLWDWNLQTNELYFSPEWKRQLGFDEHELADVFESWSDRLHPDDRHAAITAASEFHAGIRARYDVEFRLRHKDGSYRWILAQADIRRDASGIPERMMGSHVDITERKRTEAALLDSEQRFQYVLEATRDGVWDWMIDTGDVYFSPQWLRLLGYEPGEVPPRVEFFYSVTHPDEADRIRFLVNEHLAGRTEDKQDEVRLRTKSGEYRWFFDRGRVVARDADGRPLRMVGTITDITDRKRAEAERAKLENQLRQLQKMESIGRLAGGVAHDFNNMLGVMLGHAEMALDDDSLSTHVRADLLGIRDAATRSANITKQLLAFARQQSVTPEILNLNDRVKSMMSMLPRLLGEDVELISEPGEELWTIRIDPSQVDQILTNLCVNARRAIENIGTITIATQNVVIDAEFCADRLNCYPGDYVRLSVTDTGRGMDEAIIANIFEPFFTTSETGDGIGLGLATVFGVVSQNNGYIDVSSTVGKGSTFDIFLPRYLGPVPESRADGAGGARPRGQQTILVVEDEPALLNVTTKMLTAQGYKVLQASGPESALRVASEHDGVIHLLLSDVIMPGMNGRDLATALESLRPNIRHLFMSGYPAEVIANRGVIDEGVSFIQKPFRIAELAGKVREVMDGA